MCAPAVAAAPAVASAAGGTAAAAGSTAAAVAASQAAAVTMANMMYTSLAISAITSGTQFMMQNEQASQQASYQNAMSNQYNTAAEQNALFANQEFIDQNTAENIALMQKDEASSVEIQRIERERKEAMGTALASSESAGQSLNFLMNDYHRQEANYRNGVKSQNKMDRTQRDIAVKGYRKTAVNRGKSQQGYIAQPVNNPNPLGATLGFAGKTLNAYIDYTDRNRINAATQ